MSGYTKRMMEVAAEWLAVNPDPDSPFVNVPGLDKNRPPPKIDLARYERIAREHPELAPEVEKIKEGLKRRAEAAVSLHETETQLEEIFSRAPTPGHQKYETDGLHHADVGRWCLAWARQGYNVFDLSPDFTAAILLTDAREMDISDVRLPFAGMLFMIEGGFAKGAEGTSYTKIHVTELPRRDRSMLEARDTMVDALKDLSPTQVGDVLRNAQAKLDAPVPPSVSLVKAPAPDPSDTAIHIHASDGTRVLETWIDRKGLSWDAFDDLPDDVTDDADRAARHALRQIVFGTIAYINAVEGAMEQRFAPSPTKKTKKPDDKVRASHWTVGRTIKIDPRLVAAVRAGSREVAFRLKHRHIVRGHYRNQAHGPARSLRTKKWIACYWKGPEEGATLVHTYKLDETKEPRS